MKAKETEVEDASKEDQYGYPIGIKTYLPQILAVSVKNIILLTFGTSLGFVTVLIPAIQKSAYSSDLNLSPEEISWISSINLICVPIGCIVSGPITTAIGRKRAMQLVNIPFIISWILFNTATNVDMLYASLAISGVSGGLLEAPVMIYVAEITQPKLRGALASTSTMSIIFGTMLQFVMATALDWRTIALINLAPPIVAVVCLFFVPEAPQWLIINNRQDDAKKSLQWLRGWTTPEAIEAEYNDLVANLNVRLTAEDANKGKGRWERFADGLKPFATLQFAKGYGLVAFTFFLGHFSGMTTLQTYAVVIFDTLQAPMDKFVATVLLGVVELLGTFVCIGLIHFTGKRPLFFFSTIGSAICFAIVGGYAFHLQTLLGGPIVDLKPQTIFVYNAFENSLEDNSLSWLPLTFLIASAFISHCGIRLLPWVLIGEVFSIETRSAASGLSGGIGYIFGFVSNKIFYDLIAGLTLPGTFWLYTGISITGTIILYFGLPETEGYSLAEIERHFKGEKKLPNRVNRKKVNSINSSDGNVEMSHVGIGDSTATLQIAL